MRPTLSADLNSPKIGAIFAREFIALERHGIIDLYETIIFINA